MSPKTHGVKYQIAVSLTFHEKDDEEEDIDGPNEIIKHIHILRQTHNPTPLIRKQFCHYDEHVYEIYCDISLL